MNELIYNLWFDGLSIKKVDKVNILNTISPEEFYNCTAKDYIELGMDFNTLKIINKSKELEQYTKICEYLKREEIKFILYRDQIYPESLKNIYDPPVGLFIKGKLPDMENSIAIVGARKATDYGKSVAYKFAYELASRGIVVVSGMARGIDGCSHRGAVDAQGITAAVMGSGFNNIYPKENINLFYDILGKGCVITEYLPDMPPLQKNFPERNRIISGLSKYVLVVEAGEKSGSLITVDFALEQGKTVLAVPGNIFSYGSVGTNKLIKDGAIPVSCIEDIIEELQLPSLLKCGIEDSINEHEKIILDMLKSGGMNIEFILSNAGINSEYVLTTLSRLECKGLVKKMYGSYYILC